MKRIFWSAMAVTGLVVVYNVRTRGGPILDLTLTLPWLTANALQAALTMFLTPGTAALWYLGVEVDSLWRLAADLLLSWYIWLATIRSCWFGFGRPFGIASIASFGKWRRLWLPWRRIYRRYLRFKAWLRRARDGQSTGGGCTSPAAAAVKLYTGGDQLPLGRLEVGGVGLNQPVALEDESHLAVIAKTGAGKSRWIAWPVRLTDPTASTLVIDVGGEIVDAVGQGLKDDGHAVFVLDPFHLSDHPCCYWNPVDEILKAIELFGPGAAIPYAMMLSDALVPELNHGQPIFTQGARQIQTGVILFVLLCEPPERRNLVRVRELSSVGLVEALTDRTKQSGINALAAAMARTPEEIDDRCGGKITAVIAGAAEALKNGKNREGGNPFLSTLLTATRWIEIPQIAATLTRSDFSVADLKLSNACVFVVASVLDIHGVANGWVRAISKLTFYAFANIKHHLRIPCTFFMDEMPHLGIEDLDTAAATVRKYGIRLVAVTQDIPTLQKAYPTTWRTFLSSAGAILLMATDDIPTLQYFMELAGKRTIEVNDGDHWLWRMLGLSKRNGASQTAERDVITVPQLRDLLNRSRRHGIVVFASEGLTRIALEGYDTALALWQYVPSKRHKEKLLRRMMRRILAPFWLRVHFSNISKTSMNGS